MQCQYVLKLANAELVHRPRIRATVEHTLGANLNFDHDKLVSGLQHKLPYD
jgi:hypothetical protein